MVSMNNSFLEVRVPVDNFDAFSRELQGVGKIVSHHMSSSDITQQMTDTESRIAALELLKKRLHEIAQKAATVEDMLNVEQVRRSDAPVLTQKAQTYDFNMIKSVLF